VAEAMSQRIITFGDLETTGVNLPEERIIETCLIQFDLDTEKELKAWLWRSNPLCKIQAKAQKVHGITLADLANEPTFDVIAPAIRGVIEPSFAFVAHNLDEFDGPFLERELARVGQRITMPRGFDTMKMARWATANGKNPRLGELATCLDVPYDPTQAHGAEYDVRVMAQCFFEARRIGWFTI
jgi:DNA polymerase III subunit epsilon